MGGNLFLKQTTDGTIGHSGRNEWATSDGNGPRSRANVLHVCKECCCVVLGFILYVLSIWTTVFWQPCEKRSEKVPYARKGFCVHLGRGSNPGPPTRLKEKCYGQTPLSLVSRKLREMLIQVLKSINKFHWVPEIRATGNSWREKFTLIIRNSFLIFVNLS